MALGFLIPAAWGADIDAILRLKQDRHAIVLAHNYQTPEIYNCVADVVGDSLQLARMLKQAGQQAPQVRPVHLLAT